MPTRRIINLKEIFDANSNSSKSGDGMISTDKIGDLLRYTGLNPTEQLCHQIKSKNTYFKFNSYSYSYRVFREGNDGF